MVATTAPPAYVIERDVEQDANGTRIERWIDLKTSRTRILIYSHDELVVQRVALPRSCGVVIVTFDYATRTERRAQIDPPGCPAPENEATTRARYRSLVGGRSFTFVSSGRLRGHPARRYRRRVCFPKRCETTDLWVDAVTSLPIREQTRSVSGRTTGTTTYAWLRRTRANLAELALRK